MLLGLETQTTLWISNRILDKISSDTPRFFISALGRGSVQFFTISSLTETGGVVLAGFDDPLLENISEAQQACGSDRLILSSNISLITGNLNEVSDLNVLSCFFMTV